MGTALELPLARRAQLAVVAHIRHVYTDYDKLLKKTSFQVARRQVEDSTLERLVQWRGDDESGMPELEDVFREVIVISDDEEEDEDKENAENCDVARSEQVPPRDRDLSVEFLSAHVVTDKVDATAIDDTNHTVSPSPVKIGREPLPSRHGANPGTKSQVFDKSKIDRRGFSRYQAWDRAMNRYREKKLHRHDEDGLRQSSMISGEEAVVSSRQFHNRVNQAPGRPLTPIIERIFDHPLQGVAYESRPHSSDRIHRASAHGPQDDNRIQSVNDICPSPYKNLPSCANQFLGSHSWEQSSGYSSLSRRICLW